MNMFNLSSPRESASKRHQKKNSDIRTIYENNEMKKNLRVKEKDDGLSGWTEFSNDRT